MSRLSVRLLLLSLAVVSAGSLAAAQEIHVDHDRETVFLSFKSFAWKENASESLEEGDVLAHSRIVNAIKHQLSQGGLYETDSSPDLYVTYYANATREVRVDTSLIGYTQGESWLWDPYWSSTYGTWFLSAPYQGMSYPRGSLVIDLWDARTGTHVFRGVAEEVVPSLPSDGERQIYDAVGKIVGRFNAFRTDEMKVIEKAANEDKWRRWSFGGGVTNMSTTGSYGNNAAIINTRLFGEDGIPGTGDAGEKSSCLTLVPGYYPDVDPFCDPRPDDLVERSGTVEDALGLGLSAAFDVTRRFQLVFDAAYIESEVGPIDVFATETYPGFVNNTILHLFDRERSEPIQAGEIIQIPLTLSGLFRMRPDTTIRPYVGAGVGVILAEVDRGDEVDDLVAQLETLRVRGFSNEWGRNVTPPLNRSEFEFNSGVLRFNDDIEIEVGDAYEAHLQAGLEYMISKRVSLTFDARYRFTSQEVTIEIMGQEQLDIFTWPDEIYHPNGRLKVFSPTGGPPNPFCIDVPRGYGCAGLPPGKRITPIEGPNMGNGMNGPPFRCPGRIDFDGDGIIDYCYGENLRSASGRDIMGMWVVQGGTVEMTGYAFTIGARLHF